MCSSAPDTSRSDAVGERIQGLSEDQWKWVQTQYEAEAPNRAAATDMASKVGQKQLDVMDEQLRQGKETYAYNDNYRQLERQILDEARGYDTEATREAAAGKASAGIEQKFGAAVGEFGRTMSRDGVTVDDGAYQTGVAQMLQNKAAASAFAENSARERVSATGRAMKADAAAMGRGLPSQQAAATSLALTAGNNATGTAMIPMQVGQQGVNMMNTGFTNAIGGLNTSSNIFQGNARLTQGADAANSQTMAGVGSAVGGIAIAI